MASASADRDRTEAFKRFRDLTSGVMIATDVAARGLNLKGVHWIIQQDLPQVMRTILQSTVLTEGDAV